MELIILLIVLFVLGSVVSSAFKVLSVAKDFLTGASTPTEPPPSTTEIKKLERKLGQLLNRFDKLYERMVGLERQVRELERTQGSVEKEPSTVDPAISKAEKLAGILSKEAPAKPIINDIPVSIDKPVAPSAPPSAESQMFQDTDDLDARLWPNPSDSVTFRPDTVALPPSEPLPPVSPPIEVSSPIEASQLNTLQDSLPRLLQEEFAERPPPLTTQPPIQSASGDLRDDPLAELTKPISAAPVTPVPDEPQPPAEPPSPPWTARFENIDWASFLGTKLFAWLGGFALFLGMAYFVSYAIENNLITMEMRVGIGFLLGIGAIVGGLFLEGRGVQLTVQGLCAAGVATLYADIVAARLYEIFGVTPTLIFMVTNTVVAFTLAVRLDAQFVAILGLVGGFLTPPILSTGHDNPIGLFAFILVLNCGLLAVTRRKGWSLLIGLGAIGTVLTQLGWTAKFFEPEKAVIGAGAVLLFAWFYTFAWHLTRGRPLDDRTVEITAQSVPMVSFWYPAFLLIGRSMPEQASLAPAVMFGLEIPLFILAWCDVSARTAWAFGQCATFGLLALWGERLLGPNTLLQGFIAFLIPSVAAFMFRIAGERAGCLDAPTPTPSDDNAQTGGPIKETSAWFDPIRLAARITPLASFFFVFQWLSRTPSTEGPLAAFMLLFLYDILIGWQARTDLDARTIHLWAALGTGGLFWIAVFQGLVTAQTAPQFLFAVLFGFVFYFGTWLHFYRKGDTSQRLSLAARIMPLVVLTLVGFLMTVRGAGDMTGFLFGVILLMDLAVVFQAWHQRGAGFFHRLGAVINYGLIWIWCLEGSHPTSAPWTTWGVILFCPLLYLLVWQADFWRKREPAPEAGAEPGLTAATPPSLPPEPSPLAGTPFDGFMEDDTKQVTGLNPDFAVVAAAFPLAAMTHVIFLLGFHDLAASPWFVLSLIFLFQTSVAWQAWNHKGAQFWHLLTAGGGTIALGIWNVAAFGSGQVANAWLLAFIGPAAYGGFWFLAHRKALSTAAPDLWENGEPGTLAAYLSLPARLLPIVHGVFAFEMINHPITRERPLICLSLLFALDLLLALQTLRDDGARPYHFAGSVTAFLLLLDWCSTGLTNDNLAIGLGFFLAFAFLHAALPILLQRLRPTTEPYLLGYLLAPLMLVLMMIPLSTHEAVSSMLWPAILVVNLVTLITAWMLAWVWAALAMLLLTMSTLGLWAYRLSTIEIPHFLAVEIFFAFLFHGWGFFISSRKTPEKGNISGTARLFLGLELPPRSDVQESPSESSAWSAARPSSTSATTFPGLPGVSIDEMTMVVMPSLSAFLPFVLLMMVVARLPIPDPTMVFGLTMVLVLMLLRMVQLLGTDLLAPIALISTALLEFQWHTLHFSPDRPWAGIGWYLAFTTVFFVFPFLYRDKFIGRLHPWLVSSTSGVIHFYFLYLAIGKTWGFAWMGLLPATMAIPFLAGLYHLVHKIPSEATLRNTLLALFGGVSLFFITLIFPIQFDREWWTVGWALEGAALLWLYRRVPHEGLKGWGVALLLMAFARLGLNEQVFVSYPRGGRMIFNWYLYAYTTVSAALLCGAYWLPADRDRLFERRIPPILQTLAGLLLFLLLNIEIADSFSTGASLTFDIFSADLGRSMTYSIGWSLFGLGLLSVGIAVRKRSAILCSLGLLVVTIFKVFFYDLWNLEGLYKVASLIGLAAALLLVSTIYQKFAVNALGTPVSPPANDPPPPAS